MVSRRLYADDYDQASAQVWRNHPGAMAIALKYLYCGWYEYTVWV